MFGTGTMPDVKFTRGLGDWDVQVLSADALLSHMDAAWSREDNHVCEYIEDTFITRPFFDFDSELPDPPTPSQLQQAHARCEAAIRQLFGPVPTFDFEVDVVRAHRHGFVPAKNTHKISFRYWVRRFCLPMGHLPWLIKACASDETAGVFDLSIYSKRRLMAVVGGCKGRGDHRVLDMDDRSQARWTLCQVLEGDERHLDMTDEIKATPYGGSRGTAPANWDVLEAALVQAGFRDPVCVGRRAESITIQAGNLGVDCPCCPNVHDSQNWFCMEMADGRTVAKSYSARCKARTIMTPACQDIVPAIATPICHHLGHMGFHLPPEDGFTDDMTACKIVRQHLESCPICKVSHLSDKWYLEAVVNECYTLRNSEKACRERLVWFCGPETKATITNEHLQDIFNNPNSHAPYVQLYVQEHRGTIMSDPKGALYVFDGVRWQPQLDQQVANAMDTWFQALFRKFFQLFSHEDSLTTNTRQLDDIRKKVRSAKGHILNESTISKVLTTIKRKVVNPRFHEVMDQNPMLLAFNNGILELDTMSFRQGRPDDMVTKTTGYDYEDRGGEDYLAVEAFMEAIYPIQAERDVAQLYFGYCCRGDHPEKKLAMLTDQGGARTGYNGKTTVVKALHAALGDDYSTKGKEAFLYKNDSSSETANSHNAGDLDYKGKRVAFWEELSAHKHLADAKLKDLNGSGAVIKARGCHELRSSSFEWTAKMLLCFNQANLPDLDYSDKALLDRILVLTHRSKFCDNDKEYDDQKHLPFTFRADPDMKQNIQKWRPQLIHWFLKGLQRYCEVGFRQIPASCEEWKQALIQTKDTVLQFVEDALEKTGDINDGVDTNSLYDMYTRMFIEEKNKKTRLGKRKWFEQLQQVMTTEGYVEDPRSMPDGSRRRRTWLGWRTRSED